MATKQLDTINIKGKNYVTVNERIKAFRSNTEWAGWTLKTIAHELTNDIAIMEAQILDKEGRLIANGFARESRTQAGSVVNATSYIENCETSAWGRALGNLGIGIDDSICSAQELLVAIGMQQSTPASPVEKKGGAIYPAKEPSQPAQQEPQFPPLTPRLQEELDSALAECDFAQTRDQLVAVWDRYKAAEFNGQLAEHIKKIKQQHNW